MQGRREDRLRAPKKHHLGEGWGDKGPLEGNNQRRWGVWVLVIRGAQGKGKEVRWGDRGPREQDGKGMGLGRMVGG